MAKYLQSSEDIEINEVGDNLQFEVVKEYFESGSNTNGYYIKYSDGTMIQWGSYDTGHTAFTSSYGNIYYDNSYHTIPFPQTFVGDRPSVSLTPFLQGGMGGANMRNLPSASSVSCYVYSMASYTYSSNVIIYWQAIGRWKE
jgi:hypothetical protein